MSLMNKLTSFARSEKGKQLIDKAQAIANDPKNREKLETARGKVEQSIGAAKHKLAEKRGEKSDTAAPVPAEAGPDPATEAAVDAAAQKTTPPPPPAYGGDDGPKAA